MSSNTEDKKRHLDIATEALRQTELQLEDLNGLATSADSRAMAIASVYGALSTFLLTFQSEFSFQLPVYLCSVGLFFAAWLAILSCSPRKFHIRGHLWKDWVGHIDDNDSYYDAIVSQAEENDTRIAFNFKCLDRSAQLIELSYKVAALSLGVLILLQVVLFLD